MSIIVWCIFFFYLFSLNFWNAASVVTLLLFDWNRQLEWAVKLRAVLNLCLCSSCCILCRASVSIDGISATFLSAPGPRRFTIQDNSITNLPVSRFFFGTSTSSKSDKAIEPRSHHLFLYLFVFYLFIYLFACLFIVFNFVFSSCAAGSSSRFPTRFWGFRSGFCFVEFFPVRNAALFSVIVYFLKKVISNRFDLFSSLSIFTSWGFLWILVEIGQDSWHLHVPCPDERRRCLNVNRL